MAHHVLRRAIRLNVDLTTRLETYKSTYFKPYTIGLHIRERKIKNIGQVRTYATVALELAEVTGRPSADIGFHIATDSLHLQQETIEWLGKNRTSHLPINFARTSAIGHPGGSDEDAAVDFVALGSCNAVITTYSSSFGQWAASWSGKAYLTILQRQSDYSNNKEVAFWRSISSEPCNFLAKWFVMSPNAGRMDMAKMQKEYDQDLETKNWDAIAQKREERAVSLLLASPGYLHHTQCHGMI